jgi:hypothetical protein
MALLSSGKSLKLAESWQPPEETEDSSEDDDDEEETDTSTNQPTEPNLAATHDIQPAPPRADERAGAHQWPDTVNQTTPAKWWYDYQNHQRHLPAIHGTDFEGSNW